MTDAYYDDNNAYNNDDDEKWMAGLYDKEVGIITQREYIIRGLVFVLVNDTWSQ